MQPAIPQLRLFMKGDSFLLVCLTQKIPHVILTRTSEQIVGNCNRLEKKRNIFQQRRYNEEKSEFCEQSRERKMKRFWTSDSS